VGTDAQTEPPPPSSHAAALLGARVTLWQADIANAWQAVGAAGEQLAALQQGAPREGEEVRVDGSAFMAAACELVDRVRDALDEANAIVQGVPGAVDEEAQARLQELIDNALLLKAALAADGPHA
jgi:hypothetical protein